MITVLPESAATTWRTLAEEPNDRHEVFDPTTAADLPPPAGRWLRRAIPAGAPLLAMIEVEMEGRIRLGRRWLPFTARQILRGGVGFVWQPVVGGRLLRFVGADVLGPDDARMEFRLHGLIPVARASGPDTARSAAGRLAAETVAWLPQAATPQCGARWSPVDDLSAVVTLETPAGPIDVLVTVADDGTLTGLRVQRWDAAADPPALRPFGGEFSGEAITPDGVRIAGTGTVGWDHGGPGWAEGRFFEFTLALPHRPIGVRVAGG